MTRTVLVLLAFWVLAVSGCAHQRGEQPAVPDAGPGATAGQAASDGAKPAEPSTAPGGGSPSAPAAAPPASGAEAAPAPAAPEGAATAPAAAPPEPPPAEPGSVVAQLRAEAVEMRALIDSPWVRSFLSATESLPKIAPRTVFLDREANRTYSATEADALDETTRSRLTRRVLDEQFYYTTRYGTPLAYARPLQIIAEQGFNPVGRKILDFGYGGIGQLRLLAWLGGDVCGVEVDPLLRALYSDAADQGPVGSRGGRLRLVDGRFPADPAVRDAVGAGYDLILSKNVLKRGYIHPEQPVPDRQLVHLGVEDQTFLRTLHDMLRPGGLLLIYNLSPAPNGPGQPYRPWADGRCPFPPEFFETAGFRVLAFDRDDSIPAREMAHALGWDKGDGAMKLETDLFAHFTLARVAR